MLASQRKLARWVPRVIERGSSPKDTLHTHTPITPSPDLVAGLAALLLWMPLICGLAFARASARHLASLVSRAERSD